MGPVGGTAFPMNVIVAGRNALATDMVGARIMGFDGREIKFIQWAIKAGMGPAAFDEIKLLGCPLADVQRKFVTAQSVVLRQYEEMGIKVVSCNACSGCWAEFRHLYYSLGNQRTKLQGMTFVLGQVKELPKAAGEKVIVLGKCAKAVSDRGRYVPGCPPHHSAIEQAACEAAEIDASKIDRYV